MLTQSKLLSSWVLGVLKQKPDKMLYFCSCSPNSDTTETSSQVHLVSATTVSGRQTGSAAEAVSLGGHHELTMPAFLDSVCRRKWSMKIPSSVCQCNSFVPSSLEILFLADWPRRVEASHDWDI